MTRRACLLTAGRFTGGSDEVCHHLIVSVQTYSDTHLYSVAALALVTKADGDRARALLLL